MINQSIDSAKLQMLKILFLDTNKSEPIVLEHILNFIEDKCSKFGVDTNLRFAHFIAQAREEIGPQFEPITENLNYSKDALPKLFSQFRNNNLASIYGRTSNQKANQIVIANIAYANRNGNGNADSDGDGDMDKDDDGYKYRGAGLLQITGKYNFIEVQKRIEIYYPDKDVNIINDGEVIYTLEGAILAGLGFWIWKDCYARADIGATDEAVDAVTSIINKHTHSYDERKKHFNLIKHLI